MAMPTDKMPTSGEEHYDFRDAFIDVISMWSQRRQRIVLLHGLVTREVWHDLLPSKDEVELVENTESEYLLPMPREQQGSSDLINTGIKFMESADTLNLDGEQRPTIVTLIPGSNWDRIEGNAYNKAAKEVSEGHLERIFQLSPLAAFVFSPMSNTLLRAKITAELLS